ncbi:uncharacterized protein PRCAT00006164001 [Priceomyces carsonii]|uniref:uncharacterized protein n=1 Tax=Priceomyces carsonii TaxID=28549 RepID=UPI002ED7F7B6|nr:unnamed protein product [Priceomyces carsonii]
MLLRSAISNLRRNLATTASPYSENLQDVVIIGGGPAGLSLLTTLKNSKKTRHLKCTLIEGGDLSGIREFGDNPPENYTNRVVSLTPRSILFMQEKIGNWNYMLQDRIKFYNNMIVYDDPENSESRISFDSSGSKHGVIAAMCENLNIQSSLLKKLDELNESLDEKATILEKTKVINIFNSSEDNLDAHDLNELKTIEGEGSLDWPTIELSNGEIIRARLLVGADGYNSPVRKYSGIESRGWGYNAFGVVATIKLQCEDYRSIAWQRFLTTGPLAILPLTEDNATIVWSSTPELSEILLKVDPEIFPLLINAAMTLEEVDLNYIYGMLKKDPNDRAVLDEIEWRRSRISFSDLEEKYPLPVVSVISSSRARFPLKMSHSDTYVSPRVALIGDAAHTIHPLAGQGLNMGQSDVASLVDALETGVDRGLDIGSTLVLEKYVSNSWPSNHSLLGICDKLHKIFSTDWPPIVFLRGFGMKTLNFAGPVKKLLVKSVSDM